MSLPRRSSAIWQQSSSTAFSFYRARCTRDLAPELEVVAAVAARMDAGDQVAFAGFLSDEENSRSALLYLVAVGDRERVMWAAGLLSLG